ncbi:aminotransferase class IV [Mesorhizobium sp. M1423]|uniref:aminotransferase class IV n=1 Tax=Mesorhizobium sp. M1423 TaxID=2957101 RepID=UPI00333BB829
MANKEQLERGLHIAVSDTVRITPKSIDPSIKNYHWLDLVKGLFDACDRGAELALIVDTNDNIAEGPGFNVFTVKDGRLRTPAYGVLPGITRQTESTFATSSPSPLVSVMSRVGNSRRQTRSLSPLLLAGSCP